MPVFNNQLAGAAGSGGDGYKIERSLQFESGSYLARTETAGNQKKVTISFWIKKHGNQHEWPTVFASSVDSNNFFTIRWNIDRLQFYALNGGSTALQVTPSRRFRDYGSWLSVIVSIDTTLATETDRIKIFFNGVRHTSGFDFTSTYPALNADLNVNKAGSVVNIGRRNYDSSNYINCSVADFHLLDGIAVTDPYDFGEFDSNSGVWTPIEYEGGYHGNSVAGTSFANATGGTPLYQTTNEGQTVGSGYVSGATSNAKIVIPGYNNTEEGTSMNISNSGTNVVTESKWYGNSIQFSRVAAQNTGSDTRYLTYNSGLGLSGAAYFTMEAWVYPRSGSNGYNIIFEGDWNNNAGLLFSINGSGNLRLMLGDGNFQSFTSNFTVPTDTWSHVAVVNDNNTIKMFLNGAMETHGTRSKNYTLSNHYKLIGAYADSNYTNHGGAIRNGFYGYMQDIRITTTAKYQSSFSVPGSGAQPAGANGVRLTFSDTSSPSSFGSDSSGVGNNYTVYGLNLTESNGSYVSELSNVTNGGDYTGRYKAVFDGDLSTLSYGYNNDTITWTPTGGKAYTSARVYARGESSNVTGLKYKLIGGSETTITITQTLAWYSLPANGTIEYISWNRPGATNVSTFVGAIEINGTILVDNQYAYLYDSLVDTPTDYTSSTTTNGGNYCTLNELAKSGQINLSNGALEASSDANQHDAVLGTFALNSGKWYFEMQLKNGVAAPDVGWQESDYTKAMLLNFNGGQRLGGYCIATDGNNSNIRTFNNGTMTTISSTSWATGDVIGCAIDMDAKKIWFRRNNNAWYAATSGGTSGDPATGSNPTISYTHTGLLTPRTSAYGTGYTPIMNFGARGAFSYSPPSGYKELCTKNLPDPTIQNSGEYFQATEWDGNGSARSITTTVTDPDWLWIKRQASSNHHVLFDEVRGVNRRLNANLTNAEDNGAGVGTVSAFGTESFSLDGGGSNVNQSGSSYTGYVWDTGASTVSNTDGSVSSQVRASTTTGISVVKYTGNGSTGTVGHGLSSAPEMIWCKDMDASTNWFVYMTLLGSSALQLNSDGAAFTPSPAGINSANATTFNLGGNRGETNTNGNDYIAYCMHSIPQFSRIGMYYGNASSDGSFVPLDFRPSFVMHKRYDVGGTNVGDWRIWDEARDPYNAAIGMSKVNGTTGDSRDAAHSLDMCSNGFKVRTNDANINALNGEYIFLAFARNPFKNARAR